MDDSLITRNDNPGKNCDLLNSRYGHELIGILAEHCRDPSLMVRKQVIFILKDSYKHLHNEI